MVSVYLLAYSIPLMMIMGCGLFNCYILRTSLISSVAIGLLESGVIVYICGFSDLRIGIIMIMLMTLAGYITLFRESDQRPWTYEALLIIILYTFLFVLNAGKTLYKWDDYSHWGQMLKECLRLNTYYYVDESVLKYHKEYPPFGTLIEYIFCVFSGRYKEAFVFNGKTFFCNMLLLDSFQRSNNYIRKNCFKDFAFGLYVLPLIIILPMVTNWSDGLYYRTIYAEGFLITLMVYAIVCILCPTDESWIILFQLSLALSALSITKQIGSLFVVFVFFLMVISYKLYRKKLRFIHLVPYMISAIIWGIWRIATADVSIKGQFSASKFSMSSIVDIITGKGELYQYQCTTNYVKALYETSLTSLIPITYTAIITSLIVAILIMHRCKILKTKIGILLIWSVVILLVYAIVLQILYWFGFSISESIEVACYVRYMNSLVAPILITVFLLLLTTIDKTKNTAPLYVLMIIVMIILFNGSVFGKELTQGLYTSSDAHWFETDADIIINNTETESRIYLISPIDNQSICNIIGYLANPRDVSNDYYAPQRNERLEVEKYMLQYDYVYIANVNDEFINNYGDLFPDKLTNQQLYSVNKSGSINRIY